MDQSVGHEDGKVEYIKRSPNSPIELRYSQRIASGEAKHWFGPFYRRYSRTTIERIQRHLCVDIQRSKRYSTSLNTTLNWVRYQYTYITSNMVSDEFELLYDHEARFS